MKNPAQIIILILLLSGGFWIGIQWGEASREKALQERLDALAAESTESSFVAPTNTPVTTTDTETVTSEPAPTPTEVVSAPETVVTPTQQTPTAPSGTSIDVTKSLNPNEKITKYENASYGYSFDIPANVYYGGFAGEAGAVHTFGIKKDAVPETLADATVRVYYYGKKVIPELKNTSNNIYQDPAGKYIAILVNGTHSVKIESDDLSSSAVLRIIQTITVGN